MGKYLVIVLIVLLSGCTNGLGVPEPTHQAISSQIVVEQKAVTDRSRRWYEVCSA